MPDYRCECSQRLVDRLPIREHVQDLWVDHDHIGALGIAGCGDPAHALREIVLGAQRVSIDCSFPTTNLLPHIVFAPDVSPASPRSGESAAAAPRRQSPSASDGWTYPAGHIA